jgi:beta-lactamase regulating signal transducer with metallopeptidase domain
VIDFSINLQILIILWWVGAIIAGMSLLIKQYLYYLIMGSLGWITVAIASGLIIYAIKRNNKESRRNMSSNIS